MMQAIEQKAQHTPRMTLTLSRASAGLSLFVPALVFALSGLWVGVAVVLAGGARWLVGHLRPQSRFGATASSVTLVVLDLNNGLPQHGPNDSNFYMLGEGEGGSAPAVNSSTDGPWSDSSRRRPTT